MVAPQGEENNNNLKKSPQVAKRMTRSVSKNNSDNGLVTNQRAAKIVAEVRKVQKQRSAQVVIKREEVKWDKYLRRRSTFYPKQHGRR